MDVLLKVFVILLSLLCLSSGLYFHIGETEKKCFIEDIPDDTMVVGKALLLNEIFFRGDFIIIVDYGRRRMPLCPHLLQLMRV